MLMCLICCWPCPFDAADAWHCEDTVIFDNFNKTFEDLRDFLGRQLLLVGDPLDHGTLGQCFLCADWLLQYGYYSM